MRSYVEGKMGLIAKLNLYWRGRVCTYYIQPARTFFSGLLNKRPSTHLGHCTLSFRSLRVQVSVTWTPHSPTIMSHNLDPQKPKTLHHGWRGVDGDWLPLKVERLWREATPIMGLQRVPDGFLERQGILDGEMSKRFGLDFGQMASKREEHGEAPWHPIVRNSRHT